MTLNATFNAIKELAETTSTTDLKSSEIEKMIELWDSVKDSQELENVLDAQFFGSYLENTLQNAWYIESLEDVEDDDIENQIEYDDASWPLFYAPRNIKNRISKITDKLNKQ